METATRHPVAARWGRVIVALRTSQLRAAWLREELRAMPVASAAEALEELCLEAEAGKARAAAALHALVELLADPTLREAREVLRTQARTRRLFTLERLLRRPFVTRRGDANHAEGPKTVRPQALTGMEDAGALQREETRDLPDYGRGRPLTLGERKSIARRPPPELLAKVLADPHPDVVRNVLASARVTEDDVVRMVTRRPGKAETLAEVARHPKWCHRPRVRAALVLNPATPTELSITMVSLLLRSELCVVIETQALHPAVRSAA
ncbi:MAG: hypothetical protein ABI175_27175, partial [Polyangiales bacterium]